MSLVPTFVAIVLLLWMPVGWRADLASQQSPATFRANVDLVVVDAVVIDKMGAAVTDLVAGDFGITAGRRPRRIVSSEFVHARRVSVAPPQHILRDVPAPTGNLRTGSEGRSVIFAIDVDEIRAGEGRLAMRAIADYVAGLGDADRVGVVSLPDGTPRLDLTTDRQRVRDITSGMAGRSRRMYGSDMSPGEAVAIAAGDSSALKAWRERTEGLPAGEIGGFVGGCSGGCKERAERTLDVYRRHTRKVLSSLRGLAEAMAPLDAQKALILVSEGIYIDPQVQRDLRDFAAVAERARVAVYALHLEAPLMEAATRGGSTAASRLLDDRVGFDGMADISTSARGTAFRVIAHPAQPLRRIDAELSGYYLIAFERTADDADGQHIPIEVRVNRADLDVRSRSEFVPVPSLPVGAGRTTASPREAMGLLLRWPAPVREIAIDVDTFVGPLNGTSREAAVMVVAEIATGGRPISVGFEVANALGKTVADRFEQKAEVKLLRDGRGLFLMTFPAVTGRHTLTLGVIDPDGRRGSVLHTFDVAAVPARSLRMGSVMLGEVIEGIFRPVVRISPDRDRLAARVEVHGTSAESFGSEVLRLELMRVGETVSLLAPLIPRLAGAVGATRRAATVVLDIRALPPGDYILRATLATTDGQLLAQSSRLVRRLQEMAPS